MPIVCTIANVAPNPISWITVNNTIRDVRTLRSGSDMGVKWRSRRRYRILSVMPLDRRASTPMNQLFLVNNSISSKKISFFSYFPRGPICKFKVCKCLFTLVKGERRCYSVNLHLQKTGKHTPRYEM